MYNVDYTDGYYDRRTMSIRDERIIRDRYSVSSVRTLVVQSIVRTPPIVSFTPLPGHPHSRANSDDIKGHIVKKVKATIKPI